MGSSIRDLLTTFSPSLDFFAISAGDGRIKIWDALKGQIQTDFVDITTSVTTDVFSESEKGHLSVDYTCIKWLALDKKKKRKLSCSLIILGTGSGDVLALDVAAGQLKWKITDCHPGGVNSISFSRQGASTFTAGADGMICEIDSMTGNLLRKFRASSKAISAIAVSSDGRVLAAASAQVRIFDCSDNRKIQKFSGHPGAVRSMIFTDDGKYVLSSAAGERYVTVWRVDGSKNHSASCTLSMEHPAVFLDSKCIDKREEDREGLYILALTEIGVCYFWFGQNIEELGNAVPAKVSLSSEDSSLKHYRGVPTILAVKLQGIDSRASSHIFIAHGLLVKPFFQKILVHSGQDMKLNSSSDGILLPTGQSQAKSKSRQELRNKITALDRANAEDALLPIPSITDFGERKKAHPYSGIDPDEVIADIVEGRSQEKHVDSEDMIDEEAEVGISSICLEDQLRSVRLFHGRNKCPSKPSLNSDPLEGVDLAANPSNKKIRAAVLSMGPTKAYNLFGKLVTLWKERSYNANLILPWISSIFAIHGGFVISQKPMEEMLHSLAKTAKTRGSTIQPLLQLAGRLQLVITQIDKATHNETEVPLHEHQSDESDDDDDEDVDDIYYGDEDDSGQTSDDNNNE